MGAERYDAVVVGSGPNGLAAAITFAEAGRSVLVLEGHDKPGGGLRTEELLEPDFKHDVCSTIMALPPLLSFFQRLDLDLVEPAAPLAHPLDDGTAIVVERSVSETASRLGRDGTAYRRLLSPLARRMPDLLTMLMGPPRPPRHPLTLARFGLPGLLSATTLARRAFREPRARALLAGAAAHSVLALDRLTTGGFGLMMLGSAHGGGWPIARGGSESVAAAMRGRLESLRGRILCGQIVDSMSDLPPHHAALLDTSPKGLAAIARDRLPESYRHRLTRFRRGPGAFKLDWTLDRPIPWRARDCLRAATVHLGGTMEEIAESERVVAGGGHPARPFVLLVQPTLFDSSRAPDGKHVAWAYCHVPNGSSIDMTQAIEDQIERFAPGFCSGIRKRSVWPPSRIESEEPNCEGGDFMGGRMDVRGMLVRPVLSLAPYATPDPNLFLCSASTPPGGGIHGMCGINAARLALRRMR